MWFQPSHSELQIVHQHEDWLLVNKPAHFLVHPTRPDGTLTLIDQVREHFPGETLSIINRLDRETSGLVLISRHSQAASHLGKMTIARQIKKSYLTIVQGNCPPAATILSRLDRCSHHGISRIYVKQGVFAAGYPSVTRFRRLEQRQDQQGNAYSLLDVELETGRLHQIRVHLQHIGYPVVGDKLYGPDDQCYLDFIEQGWTEVLARQLILNRQALHAYRVGFTWQEHLVRVETRLPQDLQEFWYSLTLSPS
jgi:23S rRNA pseudouridine1911/1915/1917 synthase